MSTPAEMTLLLAAVAKGDQASLERLYGETCAKLYGVLLRILGKPELADEVMREVYLKVWDSAKKFDPTTATPMTWMVAMARNRAIDLVRKDGGAVVEEMPDAAAGAEAPPPLARREASDELRRLLSCLGKLDPEKQRIVLLAYYSGWSREQLARKLDIPVNTMKAWLRRSLLEIRGCIGASVSRSVPV
jgi:RNA polymerase sigma-70 factor (ECF subfamily)